MSDPGSGSQDYPRGASRGKTLATKRAKGGLEYAGKEKARREARRAGNPTWESVRPVTLERLRLQAAGFDRRGDGLDVGQAAAFDRERREADVGRTPALDRERRQADIGRAVAFDRERREADIGRAVAFDGDRREARIGSPGELWSGDRLRLRALRVGRGRIGEDGAGGDQEPPRDQQRHERRDGRVAGQFCEAVGGHALVSLAPGLRPAAVAHHY